MSQEEKELLLLIADSNEQAFHLIYKQYFGKVYAMALSYMPDALAAQDIVQEVFTRVWLYRRQLSDINQFEPWLITVTRNLLLNELRKKAPPRNPVVPATDPHETLDYRELEILLSKAIAALSTRQRQVYQLSRVEGYSHKEIAAQLGISVDVSREHLSKALASIRAYLKNNFLG